MFFKKTKKQQKGFTLLELLIVLAIFVILLSLSLFNYNELGKKVELENSAYSIALSIRETQSFGINKKIKLTDNNAIHDDIKSSFGGNYGYGIHFSSSPTNNLPTNYKKYILFIDSITSTSSGDKIFDKLLCDTSTECYKEFSINKGNKIKDIQIKHPIHDRWINSRESLDIYFKRPNPDAFLIANSNISRGGRSRARIIITDSSEEHFRCIEIGAVGDINIKQVKQTDENYNCI